MTRKKNYLFLAILFILITLFYLNIKSNIDDAKEEKKLSKQNISEEIFDQNNLITLLNYFSKDLNGNTYNISAEYGIIMNNSEKIEMSKPFAKIIFDKNKIITISSNKAIYDQQNYNTNFIDNVIVQFEDRKITASKMDFNFSSNYISIYDDVIYKDPIQTLSFEYLNFNLLTKDILINSNNKNKKVNFTTKY